RTLTNFARGLALSAASLCLTPPTWTGATSGQALAQDNDRFGNYEIRVIRPKFMKKRGRFELAGEMTLVMNQSFIYSLLATGLLDYHFSESLAIEFGGSYGFSIDKEDKRILKDEFNIQTQILRTQYIASGGIVWTPVYGKTQLPSGRLVSFDSFFTVGAGMTGLEYTYVQCLDPADDPENADLIPPKPAAATKGYPTVVLGLGQKFFLTQDFGLRWDVRDHIFMYNTADGSCTPKDTSVGESKAHQNVTLQLG